MESDDSGQNVQHLWTVYIVHNTEIVRPALDDVTTELSNPNFC